MTALRGLAQLLAAALLAGCAGGRGMAEASPETPEQWAAEQRIVQSPWLVSSEYFRQRAQPQPAVDAPAAKRSKEEMESRQKAVEERLARLEGGAPASGASSPQPGYIVRVSGRQLYTDLTAREAGVTVGATLSILSERELVHPDTGRLLGRALEEIGRAKLLEVGDRFSVAEIVELRAGEMVKPKDRVTIRRP